MPTPAIANVSNVSFTWSGTNLTINWVGTGDSYEVRQMSSADTDWSDPYGGSGDTGIVIPGLTAGLQYSFEIVTIVVARTGSDSGRSFPDYYGFIIPQGLTAPTNCAVTEESATQITITWTGIRDKFYLVQWVDQENGYSGSMVVQNNTAGATTTATIRDLDPTKYYKIYIGQTQADEVLWGDCYIDKTPACCGEDRVGTNPTVVEARPV